MSQVEPDVTDVGGGLPHLGEDVARLPEVALVGQDGACTQNAQGPSAIKLRDTSKCILSLAQRAHQSSYGDSEIYDLQTYAIGRVEVLGVIAQDLFVDGQSAVLMSLFLSRQKTHNIKYIEKVYET